MLSGRGCNRELLLYHAEAAVDDRLLVVELADFVEGVVPEHVVQQQQTAFLEMGPSRFELELYVIMAVQAIVVEKVDHL